MPRLLSRCRQCGLVFNSNKAEIENSEFVTFSGITEQCPRCGSTADVLDGTFSASTEALEIIKSPNLTKKLYEEFGQLIERAQAEDMDPDEFISRAGAIAPEIGEAAKQIASSRAGYAVALGVFLVLLKSCSFNVNVDLDVNKALETYLERHEKSQNSSSPE